MNVLGAALCCLLLASVAAGASLVQPLSSDSSASSAHHGNLRISGGSSARGTVFNYQVALFEEDKFFCSGSILSDSWVITSAKCIDGKTGEIEVRAGILKLDATDTVRPTTSADRIIHPNFEPMFLDNDIALIKLTVPLVLGDKVGAINLPTYADAAENLEGKSVVISGWGRTTDSSSSPINDLKVGEATLSANSVCESKFGNKVIGTKMCLNSSTRPCEGDAGGPVAYSDIISKQSYLYGIVSFGFEESCTSTLPVVFTRVSSFLEFIETTTGIAIDDNPPE